jgi:adenosylcobyric acid synthase
LLDEKDRKRIKGVIINKFRGNLDILIPGIRQIEEIVGVPVLGVMPYDTSLKLPEEDSASLSERKYSKNEKINIGVMRLPRISNFTDIDPLEYEPDVGINLIEMGDEMGKLDALVIPGTRNTVNDMIALNEAGFTDEIAQLSKEIPIFGICGGYQILGTKIIDETFKESKYGSVEGIGILDAKTKFERIDKIVTQSKAEILGNGMFESIKGNSVNGYELHEGLTVIGNSKPLLKIINGCGNNHSSEFDGAVEGLNAGTYFHGIFHNFKFRRVFTDYLRIQNGLEALGFSEDNFETLKKFSIDRLAEIVEDNVDLSVIEKSVE